MKIIWVMITLMGISIWCIPYTFSLFSGQHGYYNIDESGNQIPCTKCHGDIAIEIHTGHIHTNYTCSDCHRIQNNVQYASGDGGNKSTPGMMAHAASTVLCAECHSDYLNNTPDTIHNTFMEYGVKRNSNENCIACHTSIAVSINWTYPGAIYIDTISDGNNITISGTDTAYDVKVETFGNGSGDVIAVSKVTVI